MNFSDSIDSMNTTTRNASKRGMMGGYIWKFASEKNTLPELTDDGDFRLAFVQRDGDQYIYTWDESAAAFTYNGKVAAASGFALDNDTAPVSSDALALDAALLAHTARGTDWTVGRQEDFETSRTGTGEW